MRRITLPLVLASILAGTVLCLAFSMMEVSLGMVLAAKTDQYPIAKAIYMLNSNPRYGLELASALGVLGMGLLAAGFAGAFALAGRTMGAVFRA